MLIRPCHPADVACIEAWLPSGLTEIHTRRLEHQEAGNSTFLAAWADGAPVASGEVRWDGFMAPELRQHFGGCPELNGLQAWPTTLQGPGHRYRGHPGHLDRCHVISDDGVRPEVADPCRVLVRTLTSAPECPEC